MSEVVATWSKDPDAVLDYILDWSRWLALDEEITGLTVVADPGITVDSSSFTTAITTVWLSGGTDGSNYRITYRITTDQGRADDRTIVIRARNR